MNHHEQKVAVDLEAVQPVLSPSDIAEFKKVVGQVHVEQEVLKYIAEIVAATRKHVSLILGASPRASVSILVASKAFAAMNGRDFVTPEDVKFIAVPVMRHRVILTPESEMEGIASDEVIKEIIDKVEVPR
jgi:MoxR-like ATPase